MWRYLLPIAIVGTMLWYSCDNQPEADLFGEWTYYYYHGDSMVFQFDTAQLVIRKFAVSKAIPGKDSVMPFERVYFYDRRGDTFHLDWAIPTDTGVQRVPSSYYLLKKLTADSLIVAPELGLDLEFKRRSDAWPEMSKQEMIDKYRGWIYKNSPEYRQQQKNFNPDKYQDNNPEQ